MTHSTWRQEGLSVRLPITNASCRSEITQLTPRVYFPITILFPDLVRYSGLPSVRRSTACRAEVANAAA